MREINLAYPDSKLIKISHYPDGQKDITLLESYNSGDEILIKSRLNNFEDLGLIICTVKSLRRYDVQYIKLFIPYLLGARSDIQFVSGQACYLVDVIAPIINSLELEEVIVIDPHSIVSQAVIKNIKPISNIGLVKYALRDFSLFNDFVLISPDAGAVKKTDKISEELGLTNIIYASKHRQHEVGITRTNVPLGDKIDLKSCFFIVDDLIDGGFTFIQIAKEIKSHCDYKGQSIILIVTHGIFSKGDSELRNWFDAIYCTNSYKDIEDPTEFIKQLEVF